MYVAKSSAAARGRGFTVNLSSNSSLFLVGLGIGFLVALVGGAVEYRLHLRRDQMPVARVPGCLLYTIAGLIFAGIVAVVASLFLTGGVWAALVMGVGVLAGFYGGFILLVVLWLAIDRRRAPAHPPAEPSAPSEAVSLPSDSAS
jgi:hypothetical protein